MLAMADSASHLQHTGESGQVQQQAQLIVTKQRLRGLWRDAQTAAGAREVVYAGSDAVKRGRVPHARSNDSGQCRLALCREMAIARSSVEQGIEICVVRRQRCAVLVE